MYESSKELDRFGIALVLRRLQSIIAIAIVLPLLILVIEYCRAPLPLSVHPQP